MSWKRTDPEMLTVSEADIFSGGRDSNVLARSSRWQGQPGSTRGHLLCQINYYGNRMTGADKKILPQIS